MVRGFGARTALAEAADTAGNSLQWTLAVLFGAIALLGPPAFVLLLGALAWRRWQEPLFAWWRSTKPPLAD